MIKHYPALLHRDHDKGVYGVTFPDVLGCVAVGDTMQEAYVNAVEAFQGHMDLLAEYQEEIPQASSLDQAFEIAQRREDGAFACAMIPVSVQKRFKKVTITIEEELLSAIDRAAEAQGTSRSRFLAESARPLTNPALESEKQRLAKAAQRG